MRSGDRTARQSPYFRDALIETAVCLNAAQAAFVLRQEIETAGPLGDRRGVRGL